MKKYIFGLLSLVSLGGLTTCKDEDLSPIPETEDVALFFPQPSPDPSKRSFSLLCAQASVNQLPTRPGCNGQRPVFEFIIPKFEQRSRKIEAVEVYRSYSRISGVDRQPLIGNRILVGTYREFPATVSINSQDAITGLTRVADGGEFAAVRAATNTQQNAIIGNDAILFTFEYITEGGQRVILTPTTKLTLKNAAGTITRTITDIPTGPPTATPYAIEGRFL